MINQLLPPVTFMIGFLEAEVDKCSEAYLEWIIRVAKIRYQVDRNKGGLKQRLNALLPVQTPFSRILFMETNSSWTAVFFNDKNGHGCREHLGELSKELKVRGIHAGYIPNTIDSKTQEGHKYFGGIIFELYGPNDIKHDNVYCNMIRTINLIYDQSWTFFEYGERLGFEKPEFYHAKKKRDRFTPELLNDYMANYGINFFEDGFYMPEKDSKSILLYK